MGAERRRIVPMGRSLRPIGAMAPNLVVAFLPVKMEIVAAVILP